MAKKAAPKNPELEDALDEIEDEQPTSEEESPKPAREARYTPDTRKAKSITVTRAQFKDSVMCSGSTVTTVIAPAYVLRYEPEYQVLRLWKRGKPQHYVIVPAGNVRYMNVDE